MIDVKREIDIVERIAKLSKDPQEVYRKAWINEISRRDHCDDIRTALIDMCEDMIARHLKKSVKIGYLLAPYLEKVYDTKKRIFQDSPLVTYE